MENTRFVSAEHEQGTGLEYVAPPLPSLEGRNELLRLRSVGTNRITNRSFLLPRPVTTKLGSNPFAVAQKPFESSVATTLNSELWQRNKYVSQRDAAASKSDERHWSGR